MQNVTRTSVVLLSRTCMSCGESEHAFNADGQRRPIYFIQERNKRLPPGQCQRCGSGNLMVADSVTVHLRNEPRLDWRPARGRPPNSFLRKVQD